jgi:hypothetical protein
MRTRSTLVSLSLLALAAPGVASAEESALMVKVGRLNVSHETQDIDGANRTLDNSTNTYALAWEARANDGVAFGAEFMTYRNDWHGPGAQQGDVRTRALLFTMKKYMSPAGNMYPYAGAGVGLAHGVVGGLNFDPALGLALQLDGGVEFRWESVGFYTELKGLYASPGSIWGSSVDTSSVGLFGGISILF